MHVKNKAIFFLMGLNVVFLLVALLGAFFLQRHTAIIAIGLPYLLVDWLIIVLSLGSMLFIDVQLMRF